MGTKTGYVIAAGMILLGVVGTYNAVTSFGKPVVVNRDLTTTGTVTHKSATALVHRVGITLDKSFKMQYSFVAEDGKTYIDDETLSESEFHSVAEGQEIEVRYNSRQPSISASPFGHYTSVNDLPDPTPTSRLIFCLTVLLCGIALVVFMSRGASAPVARRAIPA
ncbi:MAG: hypothetical protein R3C19_10295 [Planctomycetaceae bacterium]